MRTPDDLLAEISDELSRKISSAVGASMSATPSLKVQPGFPFTLVRTGAPEAAPTEALPEKPIPVIYEIVNISGQSFVEFYLGNPTTVNGDYPVRLSINTNGRQFFFLKVVAKVESACICLDPGPPASWQCVETDVTTTSVEVVRHTTIPEQVNPTLEPPCGDSVEGHGWGGFYGLPSGEYTIYMPLLCLDFTGGPPVSYAGDKLAEIATKNPMYSDLRDIYLLGGDSARLLRSNGSPYSAGDTIQSGDPGALFLTGLSAQPLDQDDSEYVLSSL